MTLLSISWHRAVDASNSVTIVLRKVYRELIDTSKMARPACQSSYVSWEILCVGHAGAKSFEIQGREFTTWEQCYDELESSFGEKSLHGLDVLSAY